MARLLDGAELTQALEAIWQRVRRLNRYVEERAPWQLAKDRGRPTELDQTLASLAEGLRVVSVLLHPYMPGERRDAAGGARLAGTSTTPARCSPSRGRAASIGALEPLFPKR